MYRNLSSLAIVLLWSVALSAADQSNPAAWKQEVSDLRRQIQELHGRVEALERHLARDEKPAKAEPQARYEYLDVQFVEFPSRDAAHKAICTRGNDVIFGKAMDGYWRRFEWTLRSEIEPDVLRDAAFNLPVGTLSPVLEGKNRFYILRVLDRKE